MFTLSLTDEAREDLDKLWDRGEGKEAARIEAFLEQAESDRKIQDSLLDHEYDNGVYSVKRWQAFWKKGHDIWRVRILDSPVVSRKYRVIYAYDPNCRRFYVLGVLNRDFNYERTDPRTERIFRTYQNLIE